VIQPQVEEPTHFLAPNSHEFHTLIYLIDDLSTSSSVISQVGEQRGLYYCKANGVKQAHKSAAKLQRLDASDFFHRVAVEVAGQKLRGYVSELQDHRLFIPCPHEAQASNIEQLLNEGDIETFYANLLELQQTGVPMYLYDQEQKTLLAIRLSLLTLEQAKHTQKPKVMPMADSFYTCAQNSSLVETLEIERQIATYLGGNFNFCVASLTQHEKTIRYILFGALGSDKIVLSLNR
jgi:hypothetical protein